ncbi:MAG: hypothetical protein ACREMN_00660, partial [Gemmatimonadales bacterium]
MARRGLASLSRLGLVVSVTVAGLGCARATSGDGIAAEAASFRRDLGTATLRDIERHVPRVLNRHYYEIERDDASPSLLTIQTRWNTRYPLADEIDRGVVEARTRLILSARSRFRSGGAADVRVVELLAENMVLLRDSTSWQRGFT